MRDLTLPTVDESQPSPALPPASRGRDSWRSVPRDFAFVKLETSNA